MKKLIFIAAIVMAALVSSCSQKYDDTALRSELTQLSERVAALEKLCGKLNENIESLQTIVNALQNNDYVKSITPIVENGVEVGYEIEFTKSGKVEIYHGENGADASAPVIGVRQHEGVYYWTLDGEWLLDENGNKIKAEGVDGQNGQNGQNGQDGTNGSDGQDGVTPQLKIEEGYWYVSYDGGQTWTKLDKAVGEDGMDGVDGTDGEDGDAFFQSVTQDDKNVYIILADGTQIVVPKYVELDVVFDLSALSEVKTNSEIAVDYIVTGSADKVDVEVIPTPDLRAEVVPSTASRKEGKILVRTGSSFDAASKVIVFVSDGQKVVMKSIAVQVIPDSESAQLYIYNGATKNVTKDGGEVTLSFITNVDCHAVVEASAQDWISVVSTRALERKSVTLRVAANSGDRRSAKVTVQSQDGALSVEYTIVQLGAAGSGNPSDPGTGKPAANEIYYTSRSGKAVAPYNPDVFGAVIISNTYAGGMGVIVFDKAVTSIGENAFNNCDYLTSVVIPEGVTSIDNYAFYGCDGLTNIVIPEGVTSIGQAAFRHSDNLASVVIPEGVTSIGSEAFWDCYNLISVRLPESLTSLGSFAFSGCENLVSVNIPQNIKSLNGYTFRGCKNLKAITLPEGLTSISNNAFEGCSSLTSIVIPDNVTSISYEAFKECISLESVVIGSKVKSIGYSCFRYCYALESITFKPQTPPTLGTDMFEGAALLKIYVPASADDSIIDAYKAASGWSPYASYIYEK